MDEIEEIFLSEDKLTVLEFVFMKRLLEKLDPCLKRVVEFCAGAFTAWLP